MIRQATCKDAAAIKALWTTAKQETNESYETEDFIKLIAAKERCFVYVYEENDSIIGLAILYDMVIWGYLDVLFVHPEYRNGLIGPRLFLEVKKKGRELGWQNISTCHQVDKFKSLEKLGWLIADNQYYVWKYFEI